MNPIWRAHIEQSREKSREIARARAELDLAKATGVNADGDPIGPTELAEMQARVDRLDPEWANLRVESEKLRKQSEVLLSQFSAGANAGRRAGERAGEKAMGWVAKYLTAKPWE